MYEPQIFRDFVNERLAAVALDIFEQYGKTFAECQEEISRSREKSARLQRMLLVLQSEIQKPQTGPTDVQQLTLPGPPQIKEEVLWTSQEAEQLQGLQSDTTDSIFTSPRVETHCDPEDSSKLPPLHKCLPSSEDVQQLSLPESPQIKEEQDLWTSQGEKQIRDSIFTPSRVETHCDQDDSSQLPPLDQTQTVESRERDSLPTDKYEVIEVQVKAEPDEWDYVAPEPAGNSQSTTSVWKSPNKSRKTQVVCSKPISSSSSSPAPNLMTKISATNWIRPITSSSSGSESEDVTLGEAESKTVEKPKRNMDGEQEDEKRRHAEVNEGEILRLQTRIEPGGTIRQTTWAVNCFATWCAEKKIIMDLKTVSKSDLNTTLSQFYSTVRTAKGEPYLLSSFTGLRAGLNRHINESPIGRSWCLLKDPEFNSSNNVFSGVVKMIRREGRDKSSPHQALTEEDFNKIKLSLTPDTPNRLVNKVWFDIQVHMGRRSNEGNRLLMPDSFVIRTDYKGKRYATLSDEHTKNPIDASENKKERSRGFMYEQPGPLCPVASLEKYISLLPPDAPAFYLHPQKKPTKDIWFMAEPVGINHLASMLPRICRAVGTSIIYTNHCLRSTVVQRLSYAGLEARQIMSVTGHKSQSSVQSYLSPNFNDRRSWSNILAGSVQAHKRTADGLVAVQPKRPSNTITITGTITGIVAAVNPYNAPVANVNNNHPA